MQIASLFVWRHPAAPALVLFRRPVAAAPQAPGENLDGQREKGFRGK
jgi:hypothetical protein